MKENSLNLYNYILRYDEHIDVSFSYCNPFTGEQHECITVSTYESKDGKTGGIIINPEILEVRVNYLLGDERCDIFHFSSATNKLTERILTNEVPVLCYLYELCDAEKLSIWSYIQSLMNCYFAPDPVLWGKRDSPWQRAIRGEYDFEPIDFSRDRSGELENEPLEEENTNEPVKKYYYTDIELKNINHKGIGK